MFHTLPVIDIVYTWVIIMLNFEWDDEKDWANFLKHDLFFEEAKIIWTDQRSIEFFDANHSQEENRYLRLGLNPTRGILLVKLQKMREGFMKNNYDLSKMKKRPGKVKVDSNAAKTMISLRLEGDLIGALKREALRLGIPYQTLIGSVLYRFVNGELIDKKEAKKIME